MTNLESSPLSIEAPAGSTESYFCRAHGGVQVHRCCDEAESRCSPVAAPEGSTGEDRQVACPDCCGEGREATGQVSREMAQDAGDLSLTGEMLYERCQRCHGDGWIIEGADAAKET